MPQNFPSEFIFLNLCYFYYAITSPPLFVYSKSFYFSTLMSSS